MTTIVCLGVDCDDNRVFRCGHLDGKVTESARTSGNYCH